MPGTGNGVGMQGKKILVIDDEASIRDYCAYVLAKAGYEVDQADDGASGMAMLRASSYDYVLTDMVMPQAEGIETIRGALANSPEAVVVAMSGAARSELYLSMARALGARTVLQKPFTAEQLLAALKVIPS